jgi:polyhydroxyalkanoate synthesis regulator phasin
MLVLPAELVKKVDDNRGDMNQAEFIDFLIDGQLEGEIKELEYPTKEKISSLEQSMQATKEDVFAFKQDIQKLLRSFLDFFLTYGLELGKQSREAEFEALNNKLTELENNGDSEGKEAKIKWK